MAMYILPIEIESESIAEAATLGYDIAQCVLGWCKARGIKGVDYGLTFSKSLSMDAHGKYGVVDGIVDKLNVIDAEFMDNIYNPKPLASCEPKKPAPDCSCGMGLGAQPNAHHPSCPVYSGSFVVGRHVFVDDTPCGGEALAVGHSEGDGKEKDVSS